MTKARYLLAAEADKIQDLLFRASTLRGVAGGSGLLTRLCNEVPSICLGLKDDKANDVLVNEGGAFRLLFDSESEARDAGEALADYYYMATGGQLSVAEPVFWDGSDKHFPIALHEATTQLRSAKLHRDAIATAHIPPMAFCTSTGVEVAAEFSSPKAGRAETYLSRTTLIKKHEQEAGKKGFIGRFVRLVSPDGDHQWPWEASELGRYDARDYVAYLVADGNGMGKLFSSCQNPATLRKLSSAFSDFVRKSLAVPTRLLMERCGVDRADKRLVPVLPLILGGDDLFVLLPAPWAISFASIFCLAFEELVAKFVQEEAIAAKPTMAAAVVICKSKYPFYLAHQRGEQLLKEAKRLGKSWPDESHSTVTFEIISGNQMVNAPRKQKYRPTLRPYWAPMETDNTSKRGISIQRLLDFRYGLYLLPHKRQAQLRAFFEPSKFKTDEQARLRWLKKLESLVERIEELEGASHAIDKQQEGLTLKVALEHLGGERATQYWRTVPRGSEQIYGHALPDLFDAWDFLHDLRHESESYLIGD